MRICIIFRGDNVRYPHPIDHNRKYIDAINCWNNWKQTIYDDLVNNGIECDIAFITYPSEILEQIQTIINPKYIKLSSKKTQIINFSDVLTFMNDYKHEYDRFVILRCDFRYRFSITKWPKWEETGIILVNRDVHWPSEKLYADVMFIVDSSFIEIFSNAFYASSSVNDIHGLGRSLYTNNIPFHLMYDGYYHMDKHPLHSMASIEAEADLENLLNVEPIKDISQWNF